MEGSIFFSKLPRSTRVGYHLDRDREWNRNYFLLGLQPRTLPKTRQQNLNPTYFHYVCILNGGWVFWEGVGEIIFRPTATVTTTKTPTVELVRPESLTIDGLRDVYGYTPYAHIDHIKTPTF